ncbi:hypothetical protein SAMN05444274_104228 [Mariniphaga anaerophila]|uniref:Uncharacterized protein n=1 Tax=Mariniphaga anaerophila TaxID=1484053 RepID=A0A1M5A8R9_9BACT|nr:hypothetical protein SAMN05444274_104228 [Mariniphaga anaerophila]
MYLGKLCKHSGKCSVYQNKNSKVSNNIFIVKNVFCNRGPKGWNNCKRFRMYEDYLPVPDDLTPNE